jgi:hypothetical protein
MNTLLSLPEKEKERERERRVAWQREGAVGALFGSDRSDSMIRVGS